MPAWMPTPAKAKTPLIGIEPPITMSSFCCATAPRAAASPAASDKGKTSRLTRLGKKNVRFMVVSWGDEQGRPHSGAERPQVKETPHPPPHFGQPLRFENQEYDNQQTEDDGAHRRDITQGVPLDGQ